MPRFVILEHDHPHQHWDFMLEVGTVLRTWRLASPPEVGLEVPAEPLGNHRQMYLDYEGPVSGGRGQVWRWDTGTFSWEEESSERVVVVLEGKRCKGSAVLSMRQTGWWFTLTA